MKLFKKLLWTLLLILIAGLVYVFGFLGKQVDKKRNLVKNPGPYTASKEAIQLHDRLPVADLHADSLLWDRKPLEKVPYGHLDLNRLIEGNVAFQVFGVVTQSPKGQNIHRTENGFDNITLLAIANRWPRSCWTSVFARAKHQARLLNDAAGNSGGTLVLIKTREDLMEFLKKRKSRKNTVAGMLSLEGLHALEGDIDNVDLLYDAGFRMMGLTHFFDNKVGGSSSGVEKGGITKFGNDVIMRMKEKEIIVDLAHASPALIDDVLALPEDTRPPLLVSHTGVNGVSPSPRNLSDEHLISISEKGGLIGIGFWTTALGSLHISSIVQSIRHTIEVAGIDHVALGSDFDGSPHVVFDASGLVLLTEALLKEGLSETEIKKIMGGNQLRFFEENLPGR